MRFKKIFFIVLFLGLTFLGFRINFSKIIGSENQYFTLYQFLFPIAGGFLGTIWGILVVIFANLFNILFLNYNLNLLSILRILPSILAVFYFSKLNKYKKFENLKLIIPLIAILLFWIHPIGKKVWYYPLYWVIPIICRLPKIKNNLFAKSLGSTFTAHSIGSIIWLYTVDMKAIVFKSLILVVAYERLIFASGIFISYILVKKLFWLGEKLDILVNKIFKFQDSKIQNLKQEV